MNVNINSNAPNQCEQKELTKEISNLLTNISGVKNKTQEKKQFPRTV